MDELDWSPNAVETEAERPWADVEFGGADLNDPRRTKRLIAIATALAEHPTASLPEAFPTTAAYEGVTRFFRNDHIDPQCLLPSHVRATYRRMAQEPVVLAVQDTTLLDYTAHPQTTHLGPLASAKQQGLLLHSTLAITPDRVVLGVLAQQYWARDGESYAQLPDRRTRRIQEKESQKWLTSLEAVNAAKGACSQTRLVSVGDREADVYDLFVAPRPAGVDLLVRAAWDRCVEGPEGHLWATMLATPVGGMVEVRVPRKGSQPGKRGQPGKERQPERTARLALRYRAISLCPPKHRASESLAAVTLWAILAQEVGAPAGVEPLEWLLLTTVAVETAAQAAERLAWYACRWGIEVWHKVLKSGCHIEAKQLEDAEHLRRYLPVVSVVAWRIVWAMMLARSAPQAPCTVLLEREEWEALCCAISKQTQPPAEPPSLQQAVRWIARLGGYLDRNHDQEPGITVLWRGFQHLPDLTTMYRILQPLRSGITVINA